MDDGFVGLVRRRWVLVLSAVLLSLVATVGAYVGLPTTYQSQVLMTMTVPSKVTAEAGNFGNPLLALGNSSTALLVDVDFLTRDLNSSNSAAELKTAGLTGTYTAAFAANAMGPFMALTVSGKNKAQVIRSAGILSSFAQQRWQSIQEASSARAGSIIGLSQIAPPSNPAPSLKRKLEEVLGIGILLMTISLMVVAQVDGAKRRRQARLQDRAETPWPERSSQPAPTR
jgi:polysaccharide biosynthesis protein PslJ